MALASTIPKNDALYTTQAADAYAQARCTTEVAISNINNNICFVFTSFFHASYLSFKHQIDRGFVMHEAGYVYCI